MSEFGSTNNPSSSKHRKLDDRGLPLSVSTDSLTDVLSLKSSYIGPSRDEPREDSSGSESSEFNSEVGSPGYASVMVLLHLRVLIVPLSYLTNES